MDKQGYGLADLKLQMKECQIRMEIKMFPGRVDDCLDEKNGSRWERLWNNGYLYVGFVRDLGMTMEEFLRLGEELPDIVSGMDKENQEVGFALVKGLNCGDWTYKGIELTYPKKREAEITIVDESKSRIIEILENIQVDTLFSNDNDKLLLAAKLVEIAVREAANNEKKIIALDDFIDVRVKEPNALALIDEIREILRKKNEESENIAIYLIKIVKEIAVFRFCHKSYDFDGIDITRLG